MLNKTNKLPIWRSIFGRDAVDSRMRDVELLARFFALYEESDTYKKPMKHFINSHMECRQKEGDPISFQRVFTNAAEKVVNSLGARPFHIRRGINVAVFDAVMIAFAKSAIVPEDVAARFENSNRWNGLKQRQLPVQRT